MSHFARFQNPSFRAQGSVLVLACAVFLLASPKAASAESLYHVPKVSNFCGNPTKIVNVVICNTFEFLVAYDLYVADEGVVWDCDDSAVPPHTFLDPSHVLVAPGTCETVRIEMSRPPELDFANSLCYWVVIESTPGGVAHYGATLRDQELLCFDWYFEESALFLSPLDPVAVDADVYNFSTMPADVFLLYESWDLEAPDDFIVSINGEEPGSTVFGPLFVPEGEFSTLSVNVEWTQPGIYGFRDLVFVREDTFEPIASVGLGHLPEVPVSVEDPPGLESGPGSASFAQISTTPNPFQTTCEVRFRLSDGVDDATAQVVDASGRRLATLFSARPLHQGDLRVEWNGRDDSGRALPAGVYWIELSSETGRAVQPVVKSGR